MAIQRVALIFDHRARPETTGVYCRRALGRLVEVDHVLPTELGRLEPGPFDLFLSIDDGLDYPIPERLRPSAYWAIDTHVDFERCLARARTADCVFAAQRDGAERLRQAGIAAEWLPLACDPEIHRRHDVAKDHDVAFIGNVFPGPREDLIRTLQYRFPRTFVGNLYFDEMAALYSAARIVFNRSLRDDVNMRVFEAMACGALLLTDDLTHNGLAELFQKGVHLETYRDEQELLEKAAYYLAHPDSLGRIADAGLAEVHDRHTYRHRMERILTAAERPRAAISVLPATVPFPTPSAPTPRTVDLEKAPAADPAYFEHARPELLALVPRTARNVLDVGCGAGRLGASLKALRPTRVVGIEANPDAARIAQGRLDQVLVGDVERLELDFAPGAFDTVICGDVLEHLREPGRLLARVRDWLALGGYLIASVPNARHHSVVAGLLDGNWTYEAAGLLDRDHVRFFTRREIEKLFFRAGFRIERLGIVPGPGHQEWLDLGRPHSVRIGRLHIGGLEPDQAEEFYTYQYLVAAIHEPPPERGLTSIVILTHDQLAYTRECLDSLRLRTDEPIEIIVVDNASTDGTVDYLRSCPDVRLIENAENRGFPAGCNQGIAIATGTQVLLLNNDTVVTTGWLRRMLDVLDREPTVGLVGPCSNCVGSEQQVPVSYEDTSGLDGFAWDWGKAHDRRVEESHRLIGFCLLIRRAVLDQIGGLDERFGIGCYEDDDYCLRARQAGWRGVIARDAFVHHYGGRTFLGSGVDFAAVMRDNERKFREKWAHTATATTATPGHPAVPMDAPRDLEPAVVFQPEYEVVLRPSGGLLLTRKHVHLSLCMIVRSNAATIGPCLASIRPWVDEMIIVDTSSVDETPRIALDYGARLFHFPWCDDFSAARNESFRHARGKWVFWMDSDDTIPEACGRQLRQLAYGPHERSVLGYVVQVHCPGGSGEDGAFDVTVVDHVKLIRNRPDLRFEGRIHEQVLPAIRRADGDVAWTDIHVVHSGSDHSTDGRARKVERDLRLLALEDAERPEHPFTLFNLGMTYADCQRFEEASEYLRRSIGRSGPDESHLRKAYALLVYAQMQLGRHDEARATLQEGRRLFPEDAELTFRQGVLLHELGCLDEAARAYRTVLGTTEARHFSSLDAGIVGFKARQNLALVLTESGQLRDAEDAWRGIVAEVPRYRPGWRGLGDCLLRQRRGRDALALARTIAAEPGLEAEAHLLAARVAADARDTEAARHGFEAAAAALPDDPEVRHALCQFLFEDGNPDEGERALRDLIARHPDDAPAHHNLGTLCLRQKQYAEAIAAYGASLRVRPDHAATHLQLGYALKEAGRAREAIACWQRVLALDPTHTAARDELERAHARAGTPTERRPAPVRE